VTGPAAVEEFQRQRRLITGTARLLKTAPEEIESRIEALQTQVKEAKKKGATSSAGGVAAALDTVTKGLKTSHGVSYGVFDVEGLDQKSVRELADKLKGSVPALALSLFGREEGRAPHVHVVQNVPASAKLSAGELAKLAVASVGGGGGGKPDLAQGQGTNPDGVPAGVAALTAVIDAGIARL
jgi:alanyl-tRNA synthetase